MGGFPWSDVLKKSEKKETDSHTIEREDTCLEYHIEFEELRDMQGIWRKDWDNNAWQEYSTEVCKEGMRWYGGDSILQFRCQWNHTRFQMQLRGETNWDTISLRQTDTGIKDTITFTYLIISSSWSQSCLVDAPSAIPITRTPSAYTEIPYLNSDRREVTHSHQPQQTNKDSDRESYARSMQGLCTVPDIVI